MAVTASLQPAASLLAFALSASSAVLLLAFRRRKQRRLEGDRIVFLGTGSSAGTPFLACRLGILPGRPVGGCAVCRAAALDPSSKDRRNNPSVLIQRHSRDGRVLNIVIDVGKTFREAALRFFPRFGVDGLDAVVITHEHSDAVHGLDSLRSVQRILPKEESSSAGGDGHRLTRRFMATELHASSRTRTYLESAFPYLVNRPSPPSAKPSKVMRYVAKLDWHTIPDGEAGVEFVAAGTRFFTLPVLHGAPLISLGFCFGRCLYISDVSEVPDHTLKWMLRRFPPLSSPADVLVVDALRSVHRPGYTAANSPHFSMGDALELVRRLRPKRTLLVGMSHEMPHEATSRELREWSRVEGLRVELAHDGLVVPIDLSDASTP